MTARNMNRFWHASSVVLGFACIPFIANWLWYILAVPHEPLHPVPPDHVFPMAACRHGPCSIFMYVTSLQNELWNNTWIILAGAFVCVAFAIARTLANRGRIRVLARVQMISTKSGGRSEPVTTGYQSNSTFHDASSSISCIGRFELEENRWIYPGDAAEVIVSFRNGTEIAKVIQPGRKWSIHDGGKLVGHGEVITLLTMAAFDTSPTGW